MILGVNTIVIQVADQDRALAFWRDKAGFDVVRDVTMGAGPGEERWIEVAPPGQRVVFVLSPREHAAPDVREDVPNVPFFFATDDLPGTYEHMRSRGVVFVQEPVEQPWGWWSMFVDDEGNRFALTPSAPVVRD